MKWLKTITLVIGLFIFGFVLTLGVNYLFAMMGAPQSVWLMQMFGIM